MFSLLTNDQESLVRCSIASAFARSQKKARITRIRAYRNYYCHAVLMALNETGVMRGGSLISSLMNVVFHPRGPRHSQRGIGYPKSRTLPTTCRILPRRFRACSHVTRDIAAQIPPRRGRREITVACPALLPGVETRRAIRPPVPTLWTLLCERRCGH